MNRPPARMLKARVREVFERGLNHPSIQMRYSARAAMLRAECRSIDQAIRLTNLWRYAETIALHRDVQLSLGRIHSRLQFEIASEIGLLLRWLRRHRDEQGYYHHWLSLLFLGIDREAA